MTSPKFCRLSTARRIAALSTSNSASSPLEGPLHWLAGKGQVAAGDDGSQTLRGTFYDINERKQLEARLLSTNETLETRVAELREEARALEVLNRTGVAVGAELDLERLVQTVTDAGVELSGAQFGAFFYNVVGPGGEAYTLYTLSGASREAFQAVPAAPEHGGVRADVPRRRCRSLRRYSCRSAVRKNGALSRNAARSPAGAELSGGASGRT